ncbi:MAG: hypothetical protein H6855_03805 [Rhodospirillales bacterium]|nr:hypothetical protein [Rhodospirillales bacterium]MCB9965188.1 hypothetical protein [Rhodospirillales bacterium]MCB9973207.1 hypothetical protein [Rhodospirillales bacterium]MCB9979533.1 hypothetical protein [Rhodospirillales bacterium]
MIEAVNSVLSSAPLLRQVAEQQSSARENVSTTPETIQAVAKAPYISPFVSVDVNFDTAVILLRDSETGDTVQQIPSEGKLEARRRQEATKQLQELQTTETQLSDSGAQSVTFASAEPTAPVTTDTGTTGGAPISQAALAAFASGAQAGESSAASSFATSA